MELWYTEEHTPTVRFSIKIKKQLFGGKSPFQQIDVFDSEEFGRFFTLDGLMMLTEKDEFIYHDMIVIDQLVGKGCREPLHFTSRKLDDPRVTLYFEDGLKFVRTVEEKYDLIIVDSTDPFGPGEGLFTKEFYGNCFRALTDDGILVNQHENPYYDSYQASMKRANQRIKDFFPVCRVYQAHIPTYPSGHWLFGFASKKFDPLKDLDAEAWNTLGLETKYYNTDLHTGAFMLPNYVKRELELTD